MPAASYFEERVLFSPNLPVAINQLLQSAVTLTPVDKAQAERLFKQAQALDSDCLQTYFALYKFYFFQGRLLEAEREVLAVLATAARQGGFPVDYHQLTSQPKQWDMYASESTLFYLYTLKALAFIQLRLQQTAAAQTILHALETLDPEDRIGASVIRSLSQALTQEAV